MRKNSTIKNHMRFICCSKAVHFPDSGILRQRLNDMDTSQKGLLERCKRNIEEKYYLKNEDSRIKNRDFEYLIDLIEEKSGIKLSVSTLKRLWRDDADHNPHPSTLDALVSVLGYKDWLEFKLKNTPDEKSEENEISEEKSRSGKPVVFTGVFAVASIIILAVINFNKPDTFTAKDVLFTANKTVSVGVPSTVIFNYDVKEVPADSFFIQQDWNPNHRDPIDPGGEYFSSIYYMPGFHKTKLIANDTILKIIPVHIQTDGWMTAAVYNYDDPPVYLTADENSDGVLTAYEQDILNSRFDIERFYQLLFLNIREFDALDGHNFQFDTRIRYRDFLNDPCPYLQVTIHTEVHIYFIPLTLKGCEHNLAVKIGEVYKTGRNNDLSAFGTNIHEWQDVSLVVEDKTGKVYLNGKQIYETAFAQDFGKIVGMDYRFSGLGEVDYVRLQDLTGRVVYEESFEEQGL